MLKPKFITFTGLDERTDMQRVAELSESYPLEWGILFSRRNQGGAKRYPSINWVEWAHGQFSAGRLTRRIKLSAHICGRYSNEIMLDGVMPTIPCVDSGFFERTQINIADGETNVEGALDSRLALAWARRIGASQAILQCRGDFPDDSEVAWLYDRSGGAGVVPESWDAQAYKTDAFVGYAGGIGPENVQEILGQIAFTHPEDRPFWIDMEGNIRTDDWLDLDKCEAVARAVYGEA